MIVIVSLLLCAVNSHGLPAVAKSSPVQSSRVSTTNVDNACAEFNNKYPLGSGWFYSDCVAVWNGWTATLDEQQLMPWTYREVFTEMSTELRKRGNPCLVESVNYPDGAGSSAIRHLATWLFAEEMGCDWILPIKYSVNGTSDDDGSSLYCHKMMTRGITHPFNQQEPGDNRFWRCEVTNWLEFFHYSAHATRSSFGGNIKRVHAFIGGSAGSLLHVVDEYRLNATEGNLSWDHLLLYIGKSSANRFFQLAASWDNYKRDITRSVLQKYRERFYEFPRPWFNNRPKCMYSSSPEELNFAIHIRLGDRTLSLKGFESDYMEYLEAFMDTVAAAVIRRGLDTPMFHVFSETSLPCPSQKTRAFPEFPAWPVDAFQIEPCMNPITPEECPEKRAGAHGCNPKRSGIFRVSGKPLYLHVGYDVQNEITCMAKADGMLLGCSTFGQISGVLNKGIKFFSFECSGSKTPNHYKMMPPLAVAERGDLWVPVAGSWHNPSILSDVILEAALDEHLKNKQARLTED